MFVKLFQQNLLKTAKIAIILYYRPTKYIVLHVSNYDVITHIIKGIKVQNLGGRGNQVSEVFPLLLPPYMKPRVHLQT